MQKVRFWDPEHWRFRAEETRTVADQMTQEESRAIDHAAHCLGLRPSR